jgi:hypothetical protein
MRGRNKRSDRKKRTELYAREAGIRESFSAEEVGMKGQRFL